MRRSFVLVLGNHKGSFHEAYRVFAREGLDVVRASYNKVIDVHTFFVEVVFNWPGMGRLLVDAVEMRDYPIIQALVLLFSLEFILINLVVDLLYAWINPTIRYK